MTIIYNRTSTDEQNPENQLKDCESINSFGDAKIIEEEKSAWKEEHKREKFNEIRKLIMKGEVRHLIVWDLDRIYRNRKNLISFFDICKINNCQVHSFRQSWLEEINKIPEPWNEMMHHMMLQLMGWMAEDESNKKSERVKAAVRKKKGRTVSYKGNKWGRKGLPKQTIDRVLNLKKKHPDWSIRKLAENSYHHDKWGNRKNLSKSAVHKILTENP